MIETFCPKHFTLEDVDCREPIVDCPPRVPVDPTKHVIVTCGPCGKTRVVPVSRIMQGKVQSAGMCQLDECAGTVVMPEATAEKIVVAVEKAYAAGVNQAAKPRDAKGKAKQ